MSTAATTAWPGDGADRVLLRAPLADRYPGRHGPTWKEPETLYELAVEAEVTYVVVDSIVMACGGADPMDPGTPALYAGALLITM